MQKDTGRIFSLKQAHENTYAESILRYLLE